MTLSGTQDPTGGPQHEQNPSQDLAVGGLLHLPELDAEDLQRATAERVVPWLWNSLGQYRPGDTYGDFQGFITLQKVSIDTIRCVRTYDYVGCYWYLSMLRTSCWKAGITLDLSMTLVTPLKDGEEEEIYYTLFPEEGGGIPEPEQMVKEAKGDSLPPPKGRDDDGYNVGMVVT